MSEEEETYSTIFTALRHPIRRRILRTLAKEPLTFTDILNQLGIESPHLTYHLDSLGVLLAKTDRGQYRLSTFGRAAVSMMGWVEDAPKTAPPSGILSGKWPIGILVLVVGFAVLAGAYYSQSQFNALYQKHTQLATNYTQLNLDYIRLSGNYTQTRLEYTQLAQNYREIKEEYLSTIAPTAITPPISKLTAIDIALTHGEWTATTLHGLLVNAKLFYVELMDTPKEKYFKKVCEVVMPVSDYSPVTIDEITYRYVWLVNIYLQGPVKTIPPQGSYLVDAAMGEVIAFPYRFI